MFLHHFANSKYYNKISLTLFLMKQCSQETLWEYIHRFNRATLEMPLTISKILTSVFS